MKYNLFALLLPMLLVAGFVAAPAAYAAGLTAGQVQAIVSLLQNFGADSATIAKVEANLGSPHVVISNVSASGACKGSISVTSDTDTVNLKVDNAKDHGNVVFTINIASCTSLTSSAVLMVFDDRQAYLPIDTSGTKQADGMWHSATDVKASGSIFRKAGEHTLVFQYGAMATSLNLEVKP